MERMDITELFGVRVGVRTATPADVATGNVRDGSVVIYLFSTPRVVLAQIDPDHFFDDHGNRFTYEGPGI